MLNSVLIKSVSVTIRQETTVITTIPTKALPIPTTWAWQRMSTALNVISALSIVRLMTPALPLNRPMQLRKTRSTLLRNIFLIVVHDSMTLVPGIPWKVLKKKSFSLMSTVMNGSYGTDGASI